MKKLLSLIALAIVIGVSSCSDDSSEHFGNVNDAVSIVGSWYEEDENEEIRYVENGTLYDRYANWTRCDETEGRWEYDGKNRKLTYTYPFMGQTQFVDWTVKNQTEMSLTLSSDKVADHKLEKIVESYNLIVGKTATIKFTDNYPDYTVRSYSSKNERICSVADDGTIKAEGEKGITYIKINTDKGNVWVKVTVGDNCSELWYDYVGLMGLDYSTMKKTLAVLGNPQAIEDGCTFAYGHGVQHSVISTTEVRLCPECGLVQAARLSLFESVPDVEVLSYMDSRYYNMKESDSTCFYSTSEKSDSSKAIVVYKKSEKSVLILETQHFLQLAHVVDLWTDFVPLFGSGKRQVKSVMGGYGYSYLMSDDSYSKDGSDYYAVTDGDYAEMVGFVFNPNKQMSEFWIYMKTNYDAQKVYDYLRKKYTEDKSQREKYSCVFYNDDKSMKVVFDLKNGTVVYTKLTMKQHEKKTEMLGDYYEGLGLTRSQIINKYGTPVSEDGGMMYYVGGTDYISLVAFNMNDETGICTGVAAALKDGGTFSSVVDFFNSKYKLVASASASNGNRYIWMNGATVAASTYAIYYYPSDNMFTYISLTAAVGTRSSAKAVNSLSADTGFVKKIASKKSSFSKK